MAPSMAKLALRGVEVEMVKRSESSEEEFSEPVPPLWITAKVFKPTGQLVVVLRCLIGTTPSIDLRVWLCAGRCFRRFPEPRSARPSSSREQIAQVGTSLEAMAVIEKQATEFSAEVERLKVTYEFGYRIKLEHFQAKYPTLYVEEDPYVERLEDANVRMETSQPFNDSTPHED
ncbi:hypothetical protein BHM03_00055432 [Ensete ventricosum]|nr:hypothetical protein BHM03_00055432 [Ensete ventricosum]